MTVWGPSLQGYDSGVQTLQRAAIMAILFANAACVLQIARPRQTEGAAFEVAISEHVSQAELGGERRG